MRLLQSSCAPRANAEIIRPFQAVMILSSRCGRGRLARTSNSFFRAFLERGADLRFRFPEKLRRIREAHSLDQRVLANELSVRIAPARGVAFLLHAVKAIEKLPRSSGPRSFVISAFVQT